MWPTSYIRKRRADANLRQDCLDEILYSVKKHGIESTCSRLTTHKTDPPYGGVDNFMRRELEKVKTQKTSYKLEFWVNELRDASTEPFGGSGCVTPVSSMPDGFSHTVGAYEHGIIGSTKNPHYSAQIKDYHETNLKIDSELEKISRELNGRWLIDADEKAWVESIGQEIGIKLHNRVGILDNLGHLTGYYNVSIIGPNDRKFVENHSVLKKLSDMHKVTSDEWEKVPAIKWEEGAKEGLLCTSCTGEGSYLTGGYQEGQKQETCESCEGRGKTYPSVQEYMEHFRPLEPKIVMFSSASQKECEAEANKRGIATKRPLKPLEIADVYMKIAPAC